MAEVNARTKKNYGAIYTHLSLQTFFFSSSFFFILKIKGTGATSPEISFLKEISGPSFVFWKKEKKKNHWWMIRAWPGALSAPLIGHVSTSIFALDKRRQRKSSHKTKKKKQIWIITRLCFNNDYCGPRLAENNEHCKFLSHIGRIDIGPSARTWGGIELNEMRMVGWSMKE